MKPLSRYPTAHPYRNPETPEQPKQNALGLVGLTVLLAAIAAGLYALGGPPHLPPRLPAWNEILVTLQGSDLPLPVMAYVFTTAAWLLLAWIVGSMLLHGIVVAAEEVSTGRWVRVLRAVSNRITAPAVRRLVEGAMVTVLMVSVVGRTSSALAAGPVGPTTVQEAHPQAPPQKEPEEKPGDGFVPYTVQPADNLWLIAERFYGDGRDYPRLVDANAGRQMADGRWFTRQGVIQPGWVLRVPLPSGAIEQSGGDTYYVVGAGDSLSAIAARLLGDEAHWSDIFNANRGRARLEDGRTLTAPDLIWPGLRLQLPVYGTRTASPPPTVAQPAQAPASVRVVTAAVASAVPTEEPLAIPTAEPISEPVSSARPAAPSHRLTLVPVGGAAVGGATAILAAAVLARRRFRRSLAEPPTADDPDAVTVRDGFAESEVTQQFARRTLGAEPEPAKLIADEAVHFLEEQGLGQIVIVAVRHSRKATSLTLAGGLLEQPRLIELGEAFGARLGGSGEGSLTDDRDVLWQVRGLRTVDVLAASGKGSTNTSLLVPLGMMPGLTTVYVNWHQVGHLLVSGLPGGGADAILTSVLTAVAARCEPDQLRLWTVSSARVLPAELARLPHQARGLVSPGDEDSLNDVCETLLAELEHRMRGPTDADGRWLPANGEPQHLLVIGDLADFDRVAELELLGAQGASFGIRILAAASQALGEDKTTHFKTRLALQTLDEEESVRLVGIPDAAKLRGGGDMLARLEGRRPFHLRGFRVSQEHLEQLLELMQGTYDHGSEVLSRDPEEEAAPSDVEGRPEPNGSQPMGDPIDSPPVADPVGMDVPEQAGAAGPDAQVLEFGPGEPLPEEYREPVWETQDQAIAFEPVDREEAQSLADVTEPDDPPVIAEQVPMGLLVEVTRPGREKQVLQVETDRPPAGLDVQPDPIHEVGEDVGADDEPSLPSSAAIATEGRRQQTDSDRQRLVQVCCFGRFRVFSGDRELSPHGSSGRMFKAWETLAYLAAHPGGLVSAEKLIEALWSEATDPDRVRAVTFTQLRHLLTEQVPELSLDVVRRERNGPCHLDLSMVSTDVDRFLALCKTIPHLPLTEAVAAYEELCPVYQGDLLAGSDYTWVDERDEGMSLREQYRDDFGRATQLMAKRYVDAGQPALAIPLFERLLDAEPTLEDVTCDLYRCYHQLGNAGAIMRRHQQLIASLQRMYGAPHGKLLPELCQPGPETIWLYEQLLTDLRHQSGQALRARAG